MGGRMKVKGDRLGAAGVDREPRSPVRIWGRVQSQWRHLYRKIESRVVVEGDSETRRFQKVLVVVVASIGSIATLFNALALFRAGLESAGWAYVASAVFLLAGAVALLVWPHRYVVITFALLVDVLVFPGSVQVLSGGLASGLYALPWTIFAPLGAVLALGGRHALIHLGLFVVTVMGVAALDPLARSVAPQVSPGAIASFNVPSLLTLGAIAGATSLYLLRQVDRFRIQADSLLLNVLPASIAARLKEEKTTIADRFEAVTVLFADIVGFTPLSSGADPEMVVDMLNSIFSEFDDLARAHRIEKIKTIGDSYMAAADVASLARGAGEGGSVSAAVGGKTDEFHGTPVEIASTVQALSDGRYVSEGSWGTGQSYSMGPTAWLRVDDIDLVVTTVPTPPFHVEQVTHLGIDPSAASIITAKGAVAWRSAYGDIAKTVIEVDTPGVCPIDVTRVPRTPTAAHRSTPGS